MTQLTVQPSQSFAKIGLPAPDFSLLSTKNMETLEEKNFT